MAPGANDRGWPGLARYAGMGTELAGAIVGATLIGYWIDLRYSSAPKGVLIGAGIGIVGGTYNFIRQAVALSKESARAARHEDEKGNGSGD